jgi:hypothetical protein
MSNTEHFQHGVNAPALATAATNATLAAFFPRWARQHINRFDTNRATTFELNGCRTLTTVNAIAFRSVKINGVFDKVRLGNCLQQNTFCKRIGNLDKMLVKLLFKIKKIVSSRMVKKMTSKTLKLGNYFAWIDKKLRCLLKRKRGLGIKPLQVR